MCWLLSLVPCLARPIGVRLDGTSAVTGGIESNLGRLLRAARTMTRRAAVDMPI